MPSAITFEKFYLEAEQRDHEMARRRDDRAQKIILRNQHERMCLSSGKRFHASHLATALAAEELHALLLTPRLTSVDTSTGAAYLNAFLQEKTPLAKLFVGQKLFVRPDPLAGIPELSIASVSGLGLAQARNFAAEPILPDGRYDHR